MLQHFFETHAILHALGILASNATAAGEEEIANDTIEEIQQFLGVVNHLEACLALEV